MDRLEQKIHAMATDKMGKKFVLTPQDVQDLDYKLGELKRWRETCFTRLSGNNALSDGITHILDKLAVAERAGKPYVAINASRMKSFVDAMEAMQDMIRYSMLNGVSSEECKELRIYFPVAVSEVGKFGGENYAEMSVNYDQFAKDALVKAQESLCETENGGMGLWHLYPGETALYSKITFLSLHVERTNEYGLRGYASVMMRKSLTGFDIVSVIRFVSKQVEDWLAAKVRGYEFKSEDGKMTLALDLSAAANAGNYTTDASLDRTTDYSVLRGIFSRIADERVVIAENGEKVKQYVLTDVCAEVDSSPGWMLTLEDKVNKERMSFAFNMYGELS